MTSTSLDADVENALRARPAPTRLRVEHPREAFGITATAPRVSWSPPAAVRQTAYRFDVSGAVDDGVLALRAAVPSGTTAEVRLPGEPVAGVGPGTHSYVAAAGGSTPHFHHARSSL